MVSRLTELFAAPGESAARAASIHRSAAQAHAEFLSRAACDRFDLPNLDIARTLLDSLPERSRRAWLCDPLLIQGLHQASSYCPALREWHDTVAPPCLAI